MKLFKKLFGNKELPKINQDRQAQISGTEFMKYMADLEKINEYLRETNVVPSVAKRHIFKPEQIEITEL